MKRTESKDLVNDIVIYPFNSQKGPVQTDAQLIKCPIHTYNQPSEL